MSEAAEHTRFSELIEASDGLSFVLDATGIIRWVSRKLLELLGHPRERVVSIPLVELLHSDDRARTSEDAERILSGGGAMKFLNRFRCFDGSYRWLTWSALIDEPKGLAYALAFDVTDATRAEQVTAEANLAARLGGWEWSHDAQGLYLTEGSYGLLELAPGEPVSGLASHISSEADRKKFLELDEKARSAGIPFSFECELHLTSGRNFWALLTAKPELESGRVLKVRGTIQDITEQRLDRMRALDARAATERLLANVPGGFAFRCRLDESLTMEWMSEGVVQVTGHPVSAFVEGLVEYRDLLTPGEEKLIRATVLEAEASGGEFENEHLLRATDGSFRWVLCRGRLLLGPGGRAEGLEGFMLDITERRAVEDSLRAREAELFAASQRS